MAFTGFASFSTKLPLRPDCDPDPATLSNVDTTPRPGPHWAWKRAPLLSSVLDLRVQLVGEGVVPVASLAHPRDAVGIVVEGLADRRQGAHRLRVSLLHDLLEPRRIPRQLQVELRFDVHVEVVEDHL